MSLCCDAVHCCSDARALAAWSGRGPPWILLSMRTDCPILSCSAWQRTKGRNGADWTGGRRGGGCVSRIALASRAGDSRLVDARAAVGPQDFQSPDSSRGLWIGPLPGDIAEVDAYCKIFRAAELLHAAVMKTVCNPETGECVVSYDIPSDNLPMLEEKEVTMLGCMLDRGRDEVLCGRSSLVNSFHVSDPSLLDGRLPPLVACRGEMRTCCENLYVALASYVTLLDDRSMEIWQK